MKTNKTLLMELMRLPEGVSVGLHEEKLVVADSEGLVEGLSVGLPCAADDFPELRPPPEPEPDSRTLEARAVDFMRGLRWEIGDCAYRSVEVAASYVRGRDLDLSLCLGPIGETRDGDPSEQHLKMAWALREWLNSNPAPEFLRSQSSGVRLLLDTLRNGDFLQTQEIEWHSEGVCEGLPLSEYWESSEHDLNVALYAQEDSPYTHYLIHRLFVGGEGLISV